MNLLELKSSISTKEFQPLYIFFGPEYVILETYIKKIQTVLNIPIVSSESVLSIYKNLNNKSIFGNTSKLYVVREDKEFLTKESVWEELESKLRKQQCYLICKFSSLDTRSKFFKKFSSNITEFVKLSPEVLTKYIKKEISLSDKYCHYLCDICGNDYGRILLEVDKIKCYSSQTGCSDEKSFVICGKAGQFYQELSENSFGLVSAVLSRDVDQCYELLDDFTQRKDNPLAMISLLHNNFKNLLQYKLAQDSENILQVTGLTAFQVKTCSANKNKYTTTEIIRILKYIKYCEKSVKSGVLSSDYVLDYLLINIL